MSYAYDKAPLDTISRFFSHVNVRGRTDCWEWTAKKTRGYGYFSSKGKSYRAARWIYQRLTGEQLSEDVVVMHKCDNPSCVNPSHLKVGTHSENTRDMVAKKRNPNRTGERHPLAKIVAADVIVIRKRAAMGESRASIAKDYPVRRTQIDKIVNKKNWRHV